MDLVDKLRILSADLNRRHEAATNEDNTRSFLVEPFLKTLGYDANEPDDVEQQYTSQSGPVDLALKKDGKRIALIEIKKAETDLSKHELQLKRYYYNVGKGVRFGILTNGIEYRFYADLVDRNLMDDEPYMILNIQSLEEELVTALATLTKSAFDLDIALSSARTFKYKRNIRQALREELEPLSADLLRHFVKKVRPGALPSPRSPLRKELEELVRQAWDEFIIERSGQTPGPTPPEPSPPGKYISVFGYYEGHRFEAKLLRKSISDGLTIAGHQIRFNGQTTWLKDAAVKAIQSVDPSFEPTKTNPNGFQFWHVVDPADGKEHMIRYISGWDMTDEALRQRVLGQTNAASPSHSPTPPTTRSQTPSARRA